LFVSLSHPLATEGAFICDETLARVGREAPMRVVMFFI